MDPVAELFSERRYYRELHHKIFVLYTTVYLTALLGQTIVQGNAPSLSNLMSCVLFVIVIICLPAYTTYIIFRYHLVIEGIRKTISKCLKCIRKGNKKKANTIANKYLSNRIQGAPFSMIFVGQGHWYFIITIWLLAAINGYLLVLSGLVKI